MEGLVWEERFPCDAFNDPQRGRAIFDAIVADARNRAERAGIFEPLWIEMASSALRGITTLTMRMSLGRPAIRCMELG